MRIMTKWGRFRNRRRVEQGGQGMIEYGLIVGLLAVWVIAIFIALKPIFTEKFAADNIAAQAGQGRVQIAAELGVSITYTTDAMGRITADDF